MTKEEKFSKYAKLNKLYQNTQNYCGCCGKEIEKFFEWCSSCISHVDRRSLKPQWERTYFALTGKDCPYQINIKD